MAKSKLKMQKGGTPKPKSQSNQTMKTVSGNTGLQVPSYMVDATGNALPQYQATVKDRLQKAGKLSFGGSIKRK